MSIELEICVTSVEGAIAAERARATRIELCSPESLPVGGVTPSHGLIHAVRNAVSIPVHVLIRPRAGGFVYDQHEAQVIEHDIVMVAELRCEGVVIGALTDAKRVDLKLMSRWISAARNKAVTFHRAFDDLEDQVAGLEDVIKLGCSRILTSGGKQSAAEPAARKRLQRLIGLAGERIIIMPGAGLSPANIGTVVEATGAKAIHASCKRTLTTQDQGHSLFAADRWVTDEETVRQMVEILKDY
jgi:copper homeostasis protein